MSFPIDLNNEKEVSNYRASDKYKKLDSEQGELQQLVIKLAKINIVTCGNCGTTILHKIENPEITCVDCGFESEPCDFPDLNY